jgi:flavin-dependent dehydrogenase
MTELREAHSHAGFPPLPSQVDIVVVGGGVAGCAASMALARIGCSVVVIERTDYTEMRIGETLPPRSRVLLEELDVWQEFVGDGHLAASGSLAAWGSEALHENQFLFNPYGNGWHLDRRKFEWRFAQWAEDAGARVLRGSRVGAIRALADRGWRVEVRRGPEQQSIDGTVVIDASGRAAVIARQLGADRIEYDKLVGVYGFCRVATDVNDTRTLVEAVPNGWWYSSYLPNAGLVAALMTDAPLLPRGTRSLHAYWQQELDATTYTRRRLEGARGTGVVHTTRANSYRMSVASGQNWLAIGDAAMAFDPLSSQGLYNAMRSGIEASHAVQQRFAGDRAALVHHAAREQRRFVRFLELRSAYYGQEIRWPNTPFWRERLAA